MFWHARLALGLLLGGPCLLGGCSGEECANDIFANGWVGPTTAARTRQKTVKPLYCYRTLGTPECYTEAQKGCEDRLIGCYIPKPKPPLPSQSRLQPLKKDRPFYCCPED